MSLSGESLGGQEEAYDHLHVRRRQHLANLEAALGKDIFIHGLVGAQDPANKEAVLDILLPKKPPRLPKSQAIHYHIEQPFNLSFQGKTFDIGQVFIRTEYEDDSSTPYITFDFMPSMLPQVSMAETLRAENTNALAAPVLQLLFDRENHFAASLAYVALVDDEAPNSDPVAAFYNSRNHDSAENAAILAELTQQLAAGPQWQLLPLNI
jgi:hypothetical protein